MKKYHVLIQRVCSISIPIEADTPELALDLANDQLDRGEIVALDFDPADFHMEAIEVYDKEFNHVLSI